MKTNKDNIQNIIKDQSTLTIIKDLVNKTNKIVIHAYQFIKLYYIHLYQKNIKFPILDKQFISDVFKVLTKRKSNAGNYKADDMPQQLKILTLFYKEHYSKTVVDNDVIYYDKLSYILAYEAIDMITNINNNIQEHFIDHLNKFVNIVFNVKNKKDLITKKNKDKNIRKQLHKQLFDEIKNVKTDLITFGNFTSDPKYHSWIIEHKLKLFPYITKFKNDNIHYHLKSNSQDFLISMFHISNELEKINTIKILNEQKQIRLFNVLPLRTNIVGKHICIDTCGLIYNFLNKKNITYYLNNYKKENKYDELWGRFFKLDNKSFKKNKYAFNHMIKTDMVSCSILFIRLDKNKVPLKKTIINKKSTEQINIDYIEKAKLTYDIKSKNVVCIDPNYSDLIYCGSFNENDKLVTFRYTQNQRRFETRLKKYNKIIHKINNKTIIDKLSVIEHQTILSILNSETINYEIFKDYCIEKNKLNFKLYSHYEQKLFRKLKLNRYINTQKSESKMIRNFTKKFGKPKETIIVMGDYDKGDYHMKGKEPVICKKFRRIFKNAKFKTFLINEYRTSKLCNHCHGELEKFMVRDSHKPKLKEEKKQEQVCGLLRCQSVKPKCEIIHNRDKNAVKNMLYIVKNIFKTGERPKVFSRTVES
jgi:hypothetical protein